MLETEKRAELNIFEHPKGLEIIKTDDCRHSRDGAG